MTKLNNYYFSPIRNHARAYPPAGLYRYCQPVRHPHLRGRTPDHSGMQATNSYQYLSGVVYIVDNIII